MRDEVKQLSGRISQLEATILQKFDQLKAARSDSSPLHGRRSSIMSPAVLEESNVSSNPEATTAKNLQRLCQLVQQSALLEPKSRHAVIEKYPFQSEEDDQ